MEPMLTQPARAPATDLRKCFSFTRAASEEELDLAKSKLTCGGLVTVKIKEHDSEVDVVHRCWLDD